MIALQRPKPLTYGVPSWDNQQTKHLRKRWKEERARYSKNYAQQLPRKAKKKLMLQWAESRWELFEEYEEEFVLSPVSYDDPVRRQIIWTLIWRTRPGAYVSPLAPASRRKRQRRFHKKVQRRALQVGHLQSKIENPF